MREILTASCGEDLRDASASTRLPALRASATRRALAANLELAFGIDLPREDLAHFRTVRDVLQCVRLRRWEDRISGVGPHQQDPRPAEARPVFVAPTRDPRERFLRFTRRPAAPMQQPVTPVRSTTKRV